jgi:hypothetical protein
MLMNNTRDKRGDSDDIVITGSSDEEHFKNVEEVLRRLKFHGITVNKEKCKFLCDRIEYNQGHVITAEGVHTDREKVKLKIVIMIIQH